jgi:hypothetical protein
MTSLQDHTAGSSLLAESDKPRLDRVDELPSHRIGQAGSSCAG